MEKETTHRKKRKAHDWLFWGGFIVVVCLFLASIYLPMQSKARHTIQEAHAAEEQCIVYADTTALANAVGAYDTPIGKVFGRLPLASAYYYLGNYYVYTLQYKKAAENYVQCASYAEDHRELKSKLFAAMALLSSLSHAEELATDYRQKAWHELDNGKTLPYMQWLYSPHTNSDMEDAINARLLLSEYAHYENTVTPWRFGAGMVATGALLLLILFYSFYIHTTQKLQTQNDTIVHQQAEIHTITTSVQATRQKEFAYNIRQLRQQYPQPSKKWAEYTALEKDCNKALFFLPEKLKQKGLNEREIEFCILYIMYEDRSMTQLAEWMHYATTAIRSYKQRIATKLQVSSAALRTKLAEIAIGTTSG